MANVLKHYDAANVLSLYGVLPLSGTAPSGRVTLEFPEGYGMEVGTDGEVARYKINNETCTVTVPIIQTSKTNDALTALYLADRNVPGGAPLPFTCQDLLGTSLFSAAGSWIVGPPRVTYVQGIEAREWKFQLAQTAIFIGGNANLTA